MAANPTQQPQGSTTFVDKKKDKRQRNRIQGGWKSGPVDGRGGGGGGGYGRGGGGGGSSRSGNRLPHNAAYGQFSPVVPQQMNYDAAPPMSGYNDYTPGTGIGQPHDFGSSGFVFQSPVEMKKEFEELPAQEKELTKDDAYTLSCTEDNGESRIQLFTKFIPENEAAMMFEKLATEVPWSRRTIKRPDGGEYQEPRKTFWYGELPYSYSRVKMESCNEWHPILSHLKERIEANTGMTFNSVLCNLYENCKDGVQWHSDDEYSLGDKPTIASISLGATRRFQLRNKHGKLANNPDRGEYVIHLTSGSFLLMTGATQDDWQHRVPREYHDRGPRINLTFRTIYPEDDTELPYYSQQFD